MKLRKTVYATSILALMVLVAIPSFGQSPKKKEAAVCFDVSLNCMGCQNNVVSNIAYEKGVKDVKADHETDRVYIVYRTDKTNPEELAEAIRKLGYSPSVIEDSEGPCVE